ncbi:MAG TPA: hypothetical protein VGK10_00775 [Prolixibacteraceae bacterium]|jgi:hypothetical protein
MITLNSDSDIQTLLDQLSYGSVIDLMIKDCMAYTQKYGAKEMEWIPRVVVSPGSTHEGSKTTYGLSLHYQFRRLPICFDMGIREIRLAESTDDFLDLYNEIRLDPNIINKEKGE